MNARWWIGRVKLLLLFCLLTTAAIEDIKFGKVSNRLIVMGLAAGLAVQVIERQVDGIYIFLGNISVPVILFYLLFQMRVLGAGDIKLFSMIGGIVTLQELIRCMAYSFLAMGAGAVLFLALDQNRWLRLTYAIEYFAELAVTKRFRPYEPPICQPKEESLSYALSVPILFGTMAALILANGS